jgi:hypothetical protein
MVYPKDFFKGRNLPFLGVLLISIWPAIGLFIYAAKRLGKRIKNEMGELLGREAGLCAGFIYAVFAIAFNASTLHNYVVVSLPLGTDVDVTLKTGFYYYLTAAISLLVYVLYESIPFLSGTEKAQREKYLASVLIIAVPGVLIGIIISCLLHFI